MSICTGRMYSGTRPIAQSLRLEGPVACVDGSHIVHVATKRSLFTATLDPLTSEVLRQQLAGVDIATFAFASDMIIHDPGGQRYLSYLRTWSERMMSVKCVTSPEGWSTLREISAVVALGEKSCVESVVKGFKLATASDGNTSLQFACFPLRGPGRANRWALLIRRADVDKGTAIEWLAKYHGLEPQRVVVVGDWVNDVPMFRAAGKSYVMGQAPPEVREAATFVLAAHTLVGGGIREAAERSGLL